MPDYAAIAKAAIHRPGDNPRPPRMLIYGRNKRGKTRFCATAPNVLILDPEEGTEEETKLNPAVWPINDWTDINKVYQYLKKGGHPYEWVAIDGVTRIANMALRFVNGKQPEEINLESTPKANQIQKYGAAGELVKGMLHNFHSLRTMGVIITAQERMVEVSELDDVDDEDAPAPVSYMFVPDVPRGARSALNAIVDLTGRMYVVNGEFTRKVNGEVVQYKRQRRLWVGVEERYETGHRSSYELPDYIPNPTVQRVVKAMKG